MLVIGKRCDLVAGSMTLTSAKYVVQEAKVCVELAHVRLQCECMQGVGSTLTVLRLRCPEV